MNNTTKLLDVVGLLMVACAINEMQVQLPGGGAVAYPRQISANIVVYHQVF